MFPLYYLDTVETSPDPCWPPSGQTHSSINAEETLPDLPLPSHTNPEEEEEEPRPDPCNDAEENTHPDLPPFYNNSEGSYQDDHRVVNIHLDPNLQSVVEREKNEEALTALLDTSMLPSILSPCSDPSEAPPPKRRTEEENCNCVRMSRFFHEQQQY